MVKSDYSGQILNGKKIIENVFPIPPAIIIPDIDIDKNIQKIFLNDIVIFSFIQEEIVNYGYAHIFYEKNNFEEIKIYVPKAFVIISQYPYFKMFSQLSNEIESQFYLNEQIPLEIQIYNIINFVQAPIDTGLKYVLIPEQELNIIKAFKNQEKFFYSEKQNKYYIPQAPGYRATEINFCYY